MVQKRWLDVESGPSAPPASSATTTATRDDSGSQSSAPTLSDIFERKNKGFRRVAVVAISQFMVKRHSAESRCQKATELRHRRQAKSTSPGIRRIDACMHPRNVPLSPEDHIFVVFFLLLLFWLFVPRIIYAPSTAPWPLRATDRPTDRVYVKFAFVRSFVSL